MESEAAVGRASVDSPRQSRRLISGAPQTSQGGGEAPHPQVSVRIGRRQPVRDAHQPVSQHLKVQLGHLDPQVQVARRSSSSDYRDGLKSGANVPWYGWRGGLLQRRLQK